MLSSIQFCQRLNTLRGFLPECRQRVFHVRRDHRKALPVEKSMALQLLKTLREHALAHLTYLPTKLGEPQRTTEKRD